MPALEDNHSVNYFYKYVELEHETAKDQLDALVAEFEADGIIDAIKRRLVVSLIVYKVEKNELNHILYN